MAQLKDTIVSGDLNVTNSLTTDNLDLQKIKISGKYYQLKIVNSNGNDVTGEEGVITFVIEE